jgi:hypothetical protein
MKETEKKDVESPAKMEKHEKIGKYMGVEVIIRGNTTHEYVEVEFLHDSVISGTESYRQGDKLQIWQANAHKMTM